MPQMIAPIQNKYNYILANHATNNRNSEKQTKFYRRKKSCAQLFHGFALADYEYHYYLPFSHLTLMFSF